MKHERNAQIERDTHGGVCSHHSFYLRKQGGKMQETWKDIDGYEGRYQISNFGRVRSFCAKRNLDFPKILTPKTNNSGRKWVLLFGQGKPKPMLIHRLVAMAFLPNPNEYPEVNHKDEDFTNNHIDNLEWCTKLYNVHYSMSHPENYGITRNYDLYPRKKRNFKQKNIPTKHKSKVVQRTLHGEHIKEWDSAIVAANTNNWRSSSIIDCCMGKRKTAYGYKWAFVK